MSAIREHPAFRDTLLAKLPESAGEFHYRRNYVCSDAFLPGEYEKYATVVRQGRGIRLPEKRTCNPCRRGSMGPIAREVQPQRSRRRRSERTPAINCFVFNREV